MTKVFAILLVPKIKEHAWELFEGDRLLGSSPPMALEWQCPDHGKQWAANNDSSWQDEHFEHNNSASRSGCRTGIVMAWYGKIIPAGCDLLQEFYVGRKPGWVHHHWFRACVSSIFEPDNVIISEYRERLMADKRWEIVLLDKDLQEISLD